MGWFKNMFRGSTVCCDCGTTVCCAPPVACCFYPWSVGNCPYTYDILINTPLDPTIITLSFAGDYNGFPYWASGSPDFVYIFAGDDTIYFNTPLPPPADSYTDWPNSTDPSIPTYYPVTGFKWCAIALGFIYSDSQECLLACIFPSWNTGPELYVYDTFNDTYTVNGTDVITRTQLSRPLLLQFGSCQWTSPKTGGGEWTMDYNLTTADKWHLSSTGPSPTSDDKDDPQGYPTGTYGLNIVA